MSSRRPFLRRLPPMNAAARNVVPISPVGNSAIDAPAATLRSDGTLVQRVEQIPEMAAVDLSVLRAAFHLLMKVGEDQKVMKREALMTAQQIRLAMENNVLRMVPVAANAGVCPDLFVC